MSVSKGRLGAIFGLGVFSLVSAIWLKASPDTLTSRVAVDWLTFDQEPRGLQLRDGHGFVLNLAGTESELDRLDSVKRGIGFQEQGSDETDFDFSLRAAQLVQSLIPHGEPTLNMFRWWSFERVLERAKAGEEFWCDTYARMMVVLALSEGIPARSVWLDGHVTSEIFDSDLGKWVMIDSNYNHYMTSQGKPLSVTEIRHSFQAGESPSVVAVNDPTEIDEPTFETTDETMQSWYLGSQITVFDSDINFKDDIPHLLLPAMSLKSSEQPRGTSTLTKVLRVVLPASLLAMVYLLRDGFLSRNPKGNPGGSGNLSP